MELTRENLFLIGAGFTCAVFPNDAPSNHDLLKKIVGSQTNSPLGEVCKWYEEEDIEIALTRMDMDILKRKKFKETDRDLVNRQIADFLLRCQALHSIHSL